MTIKLKTSKTDQFGKGYTSNALEPPYEAMVDYVKLRGSKEGSLFLTSHEQPLTRSYVFSGQPEKSPRPCWS